MTEEERCKVIVINGFELSKINYECPSCFYNGTVGSKKTIIYFIERLSSVIERLSEFLLLLNIGGCLYLGAGKYMDSCWTIGWILIATTISAGILKEAIKKIIPDQSFFCPECGHRWA